MLLSFGICTPVHTIARHAVEDFVLVLADGRVVLVLMGDDGIGGVGGAGGVGGGEMLLLGFFVATPFT